MAERPLTVFRPQEKGLRKVFGELEARIMEVIWRRGRATVQDVWQELQRDREIAYTTVKTVMSRLADKGHLHRRTRERAHVFEPTRTREAFLREVSEEVLAGLFADFGEPILAQLAASGADAAVLERLQALIAARRGRGRRP